MTAKIKSLSRYGGHYKNKPRGVSNRAFEKVYWPYLPIVLIAGALLTFGAQSGSLEAAMPKPHSKVLDYSTSMAISGLLSDSNAARASNGVAALSLNAKLDSAAQAQANDMAIRNYWSHNTPEGNPPWVWVTAQGYSYQKLGQNLAAGFSDEQSTINGWMASPPHRENLLDPAFSDVGFGSANNPDYTSAGGGPMTIVVAFYGEPTQAAAPATTPTTSSPATTKPASPTSTAPTAAAPTSSPSTTPNPTSSQPIADTNTKKSTASVEPVTTQTSTHGITLSYRTSRAQIAFAHLPQSSFATGFAVLAAFAALGLWIARHLFSLRRAFAYGEAFVVRHPLIDVGLLTIAAISFMMSQTAGFIQ